MFASQAVQILDPQDCRVLMVNGEHLKPIVINDIEPILIESINLVDLFYCDYWMGPSLAEGIKFSGCWEVTQSF